MARRVLLPGDEPRLILEEEIGARAAPAEEVTFAVRADDAGAGRWHLGRAMTDQTLSSPPRVAVRARWPLSPRVRRAVLTVHIVSSVGLLGDCAVLLATGVRAAGTDDPQLAASAYELMSMFSFIFGIPLSFAALFSGLALGWGTKWGVLRHGWVTIKLGVIVSVILVGALVIGPSEAAMIDGDGGRETVLVVAAAYQVLALVLATGLSVYKPRRRASR